MSKKADKTYLPDQGLEKWIPEQKRAALRSRIFTILTMVAGFIDGYVGFWPAIAIFAIGLPLFIWAVRIRLVAHRKMPRGKYYKPWKRKRRLASHLAHAFSACATFSAYLFVAAL